jgi:hypothetical protein
MNILLYFSVHHLLYLSLVVRENILWNQNYFEHFDKVFLKWPKQRVGFYLIYLFKIVRFRCLDHHWWSQYKYNETYWRNNSNKSWSISTYSFNESYLNWDFSAWYLSKTSQIIWKTPLVTIIYQILYSA